MSSIVLNDHNLRPKYVVSNKAIRRKNSERRMPSSGMRRRVDIVWTDVPPSPPWKPQILQYGTTFHLDGTKASKSDLYSAARCWNIKLGASSFILYYIILNGTRGSVVGWGTMLQAGRSRVRVPMRWIFFFNVPNPPGRTMTPESTWPLTEMSTRNIPGG
jgi:hypothetical protein